MNKVTIIGLGEMGSAIARTLLERNFEVTVWNRTTDKAEQLKSKGAIGAGLVRDFETVMREVLLPQPN